MYVDAILDREKEIINVVERKDGVRNYLNFAAKYVFYHDDPNGKFMSIYGTPVSRVQCKSRKEMNKELKVVSHSNIYESDINPVFRCLSEQYEGAEPPKLNVGFIDIEADFDKVKGFADPSDPFNAVTAISLYYNWLDKMITLTIPPKTVPYDKAVEMLEDIPDTYVFKSEAEMLDTFLDLIEDCDVLSGWNSEGYDIPYLVNRITRVLSKNDTRRFCLWDNLPKRRMYNRHGKEEETFDFVGRVHMDYMQLYKKYTYEERHSYSLDAIGEHELNERKVEYEGTLDDLYNYDYYKFIEYNRQDTALLNKLDQRLGYIDQANGHAHENTVLLATVMGAVAVTEQAIINEAHARGMVVPDRKDHGNDTAAAGAYVAHPKKGLHDYIGAVDINSLYPSTIRALNMTLETIVGQLRPTYTDEEIERRLAAQKSKTKSLTEAWDGLFGSLEYQYVIEKDTANPIWVDWENGRSEQMTGSEIWKLVFRSDAGLMISANGTLFRSDVEGVIPGLLARWYAERKEMQAKLGELKNDPNASKSDVAYWDKKQLIKKINLNSLYGAILNPGCRFFDKRIGQSTTLTGRCIAKHMDAYINQQMTGEYDHIGKGVVYGDTDSCYFSIWPIIKDEVQAGEMEWNKDICVELYNEIGSAVNDSFPEFMKEAFNVERKRGQVIKCGLEMVARKGLYIKKKRYAVLIYDDEGTRLDLIDDEETLKKKGAIKGVGKVKAVGLDLRRSDTPKYMQKFLMEILTDVLQGAQADAVAEKIKEFKHDFKDRPGWEKGTPKAVNNLTSYTAEWEKTGKCKVGHVMAAIHWNNLLRMHSDQYSTKITDGQKIIVCKLKDNPLGYTSVAYPVDQAHLPKWFKELPFNHELMSTTIIDNKVQNLLGVLHWDLPAKTNISNNFESLFEFD